MATMKEVADQAGVSVATVSRVLNNTGYVSDDLRERVQQAIDELNYQPSALARSLRRRVTQTVGLLIPQLDQPFFSKLAYAIEQALFTEGHHTLICSAEESREKEDAYINMFLSRQVDGVILVPTGHSIDNVTHLQKHNLPVVLVDRDLPRLKGISRVLCDNYSGAYEAVRYLKQLGHQRIGVIGAPPHSAAMVDRLKGVKQAILEFDMELPSEWVVSGTQVQSQSGQFQMGRTLASRMLLSEPRPSAIFALTDVLAVGVLHAAQELNMTVPDDLSLIGFDNIDLASYSIPGLTTVAQPVYQMGTAASEILLRHLHHGENEQIEVERIMLDTELVIRQSTATRGDG